MKDSFYSYGKMMLVLKQKWRNRELERGVVIHEALTAVLYDHGMKLKPISGISRHASTHAKERYLGLHAKNQQDPAKILGSLLAAPKIDKNRVETVPETAPQVSILGASEIIKRFEI